MSLRSGSPRPRRLTGFATLAAGLMLAGCGSGPGSDPGSTRATAAGPGCGVVAPSLVARAVGDRAIAMSSSDQFTAERVGFAHRLSSMGLHCDVGQPGATYAQLSISGVFYDHAGVAHLQKTWPRSTGAARAAGCKQGCWASVTDGSFAKASTAASTLPPWKAVTNVGLLGDDLLVQVQLYRDEARPGDRDLELRIAQDFLRQVQQIADRPGQSPSGAAAAAQ